MRCFAVFAASCLGMATMLGCGSSLEEGQAGYAYSENEAGELVEADGTRATVSTQAPVSRVPQGSEEEWLTKFDLIERSGKSMTSDELLGQPYVASFFFSLCPSICVQQNQKAQILQQKFAGQPIRLVSISCDPEVDQPEVLAEYAKKFNADPEQWLFFTGDLNYIRRVGSEMFSLPVMRRFHAEKFVLVDADGKVVAYYTWTDPEQWQALQRDMAKIIEEGGRLHDASGSATAFPSDAKPAS